MQSQIFSCAVKIDTTSLARLYVFIPLLGVMKYSLTPALFDLPTYIFANTVNLFMVVLYSIFLKQE